jgi:hypothetical protein
VLDLGINRRQRPRRLAWVIMAAPLGLATRTLAPAEASPSMAIEPAFGDIEMMAGGAL